MVPAGFVPHCMISAVCFGSQLLLVYFVPFPLTLCTFCLIIYISTLGKRLQLCWLETPLRTHTEQVAIAALLYLLQIFSFLEGSCLPLLCIINKSY